MNIPRMLGSLELLLNPTGLLTSVSAGLEDLLGLPFAALTEASPAQVLHDNFIVFTGSMFQARIDVMPFDVSFIPCMIMNSILPLHSTQALDERPKGPFYCDFLGMKLWTHHC